MTWTSEWPTEPGLYLFYGDFRQESPLRKPQPRFVICKVSQAANGIMYVAGGAFLFKKEWKGVFKPITVPPEAVQAYEELTQPKES